MVATQRCPVKVPLNNQTAQELAHVLYPAEGVLKGIQGKVMVSIRK